MAQNPLAALFAPRRSAGPLQPPPEQLISDSLIESIASGDRTAGPVLDDYLSGQEQAEQPFANKYREAEDAIGQADIFNMPQIRRARQEQQAFELEKATAPARMQGEYAVRAAETKGAAQYDALTEMLRGGVQPGQRVSVTGVGSMSQAQPRTAQNRAPASVTNRLLQAQRDATPGTIKRMFGIGPSQSAQNNLTNVVNEVAQAEGIHPQLIQDALSAVQANPQATVDELMQGVDGDDLTPAEREQFLSVFMRLK